MYLSNSINNTTNTKSLIFPKDLVACFCLQQAGMYRSRNPEVAKPHFFR